MEDIEAYVSKLKVVELREELKKRGLTTAGVKSVLAQRLQEAMSKEIEKDEGVSEDQPTEEQSTEGEGVPVDQPTEEQSAEGEGVPEDQPTEEQGEGVPEDQPPTDEQSAEGEGVPEDQPTEEQSAEGEGVPEDQPTEEQSAEGEGREAEAEVPEGNAETQMEQEPNVEAVQQEEQEGAQSDIKLETEQELSEPVPSEPEPATDMDTTTTECTPVVNTGSNKPTPEDDTTNVETSSANDVISDSGTGDDTTVTLEGDAAVAPAESSVPCDGSVENLPIGEEKSADTCEAAVVKEKIEQEGPDQEDEKMETNSSETMIKSQNGEDQSESAQIGAKRSHDAEQPVKTEQTKSDPSQAPDPEEPDSFDDSQVLMESKFQPPEDASIITLHKYTSDLFFDIREDGLGGCGLSEQGFARLWATAQGSSGVKGGRYYYEVRIEENVSVELPETEEHPHAIRVGWTLDDSKGLGEDNRSFGFGSTGKKVFNNEFECYAESYGPGDVIGCFLDLETSPATISFSKNSSDLSTAFTLEESLSGEAFFPCVSTKNVAFSINFGGSPAFCEVEGVEGYSFIQAATEECRVPASEEPQSVADCEVIMMVGLPASGKTTWAEKHRSKYPEKRYTILGTNLIMERMKVSGLSRKANYKSRFEALIKDATEMLNKLFLLAAKNKRNYIIDQTNVYRNAQDRKIKYFDGFVHKAEVVVPPHHELRRRTGLKNEEMGGPLPDAVINAMKANFQIPKAGENFQEVNYSDIYGIAAEKIVRQYREDALGLPSYPQSKRGRYEYRGNTGSRYEYRGSSGARGGGYSGYSPHQNSSYGSYRSSYSPRGQYGYGGNSYGQQRPPRYNQYGTPAPPPHMYGNPRGGPYGGPPQHYRSPYSSPGNYRGNYGGQTPPRRGSGYYGRY